MKNTKRIPALILCVLMLLSMLSGVAVFSRETFTVTGSFGTRGKESGAPLNPAKVTFFERGGVRYAAETDEDGNSGSYSISVPAGVYDVAIEKPGYLTYRISGVQVNNRDFTIPEFALLAGDLNGDGKIDTKDLAVMMRGFSTLEAFAELRKLADFNEDGVLTVEDFADILPNKDISKEYYEWTTVKDLQTDYRNDPIGIDYEIPEFNWVMESAKRGEKQTAYELGVAASYEKAVNGDFDVWYSGKVESDMTHAYYGEVIGEGGSAAAALLPRTGYYWSVISYDKDGKEIPASQVAYFETGLFGDFGADNKWIEADELYVAETNATVSINLTVTQGALGVYFGVSKDGSEKHMWQVSLTAHGTPLLRYHYNENGAWKVIAQKDISSIIPDGAAAINKPIDMKLVLEDGLVKTYINDEYVFDYTMTGSNKSVGKIYAHTSAGENGVINSVTVTDKEGNVLIDGVNDTALAGSLFRKQFTLDKPLAQVECARLYSTAAGSQIMYMNGSRASDDYMAPGKSQYTTTLYYQTYDVKDLLLDGDNTVAADVGHGWYNAGAVSANYGTNIGLKAKLVITYTDGSEQIIDTDSTWLGTKEGPNTTDKYYIGQHVDARKKIDGWNENNSVSSKWTEVIAEDKFTTTAGYTITDNFVGENMEPVRNSLILHPYKVVEAGENVFVYHFNQNIVGTSRITAEAPEGTEIVVDYSEWLTKGAETVNTGMYLGHNGTDRYIFRGDNGGETVEFDQVYHGFQYIQITGLSEALPLDAVEGLVLTSDMERTGYIETSSTKINRYADNVLWSIRGNFVSTLTDCPTREKNTWTGDAQIFAAVASYYSNVFNHYRNFQNMTRATQYPDGAIPELIPSQTPPSSSADGLNTKTPSGWSDCLIIIPWEMYNQYGDVTIIRDNYDAMKKWIDFLLTKKITNTTDPADTATYFVRPDGNYGDHLAANNNKTGVGYYVQEYRTTEWKWREMTYSEVGTAFSAYSCMTLAQMAEKIGETDDAAYYNDLHDKFAKAWRDNFVEANGITPKSKGQTSYAMGLYFDLYENEEKAKLASEELAQSIEAVGYTQTVGFLGMNIIYPALTMYGQFDTAMKMMENENYPSLLYMVNNGATTIWETYSGYGMSGNHYVFGAPARWLYTDVLGIAHGYEEGNEGYKHFELRPTYASYGDTSVTWAKGSFDSNNGLIKSDWTLSDDRSTFTYNCTVPANTSATLSLPVENTNAYITEGGKPVSESEGVVYIKTENGRKYYEITSGVYEFVVRNDINAD